MRSGFRSASSVLGSRKCFLFRGIRTCIQEVIRHLADSGVFLLGSSLLTGNRGSDLASALLERLLVDDPQWQPLRSLREQIGQAGQIGQSQQAPSPAPAPAPAPSAQPTATGFEALLERATARLQGLGGSLPQPVADTASSADLAAELSSLERRLSDYEARFALA